MTSFWLKAPSFLVLLFCCAIGCIWIGTASARTVELIADDDPANSNDVLTYQISDDGRYVAYGNGGMWHWDSTSGTRQQLPPSDLSPWMDDQGRYLWFGTQSGPDFFGEFTITLRRYDTRTGATEAVVDFVKPVANHARPVIEDIDFDGSVALVRVGDTTLVPGDTNSRMDLFAIDSSGHVTAVTTTPGGGFQTEGDASYGLLSDDGSTAVFGHTYNLSTGAFSGENGTYRRVIGQSTVTDTGAVGVLSGADRTAHRLLMLDPAGGGTAWNVFDTRDGSTYRVDRTASGQVANAENGSADIDPSGRYVAFTSKASNLVSDDTNSTSQFDGFIKDTSTGVIARVNLDADGRQVEGAVNRVLVSERAERAAFTFGDSLGASPLLANDTDGRYDAVYVRDPLGALAACADGRDNDLDGLVDFPSDADGDGDGSCNPDTSPPSVVCIPPSTGWTATNVTVACTASDAGSGLRDTGDASFVLYTSVAEGDQNTNAVTASRRICDNAQNCRDVGPFGGFKVDRAKPQITISRPNGTYAFGQFVTTSYTCDDGEGSGVESCVGDAANGGLIPTLVPGSYIFSATATDAVGNVQTVQSSYSVKVSLRCLPFIGCF